MKYICNICGFVYDEEIGCPEEKIAPGTAWENIPDDFICPLCGVGKDEFYMETVNCTLFGPSDRVRTCGLMVPNGPMKAISAKNSFFRPFPLGKPRSSALPSPLFPSAPKR